MVRITTKEEKKKSVAAKRQGRYSTETVGEIETKPFGNDSVATTGLLPWLTKAVTTTHRALQGEHVAFSHFSFLFFRRDALKGDPENAAKCRKSEENREKHFARDRFESYLS